jgi:glycosyltransferase involved in cell wall biosynthesis
LNVNIKNIDINKQPSVCFLTRSLEVGGAERQLVLLANLMPASQYRVKVICMYNSEPLGSDLNANVELVTLSKKGRWDAFIFLYRCYVEIKSFRPDFLYSFLVIPNIISVLMSPFLKRCMIVWGIRASDMDLTRYDHFTRITYKLCAALSRFAHIRISNSLAGADHALKTGFSGPIEFVPNGIDLEKFQPDELRRKATRKILGIEEQTLVMACVARLDPMKGHPILFEALKLLLDDCFEFSFFCVGSGDSEYSKELRKLSKNYGLANRIKWFDSYERMSDFYISIDLLISSSEFGEGFSNVIVEAMACGTPVVATRVGDSAHIIGNENLLCLPSSSEDLKKSILNGLAMVGTDRQEIRKLVLNYSASMLLTNTESAFRQYKPV